MLISACPELSPASGKPIPASREPIPASGKPISPPAPPRRRLSSRTPSRSPVPHAAPSRTPSRNHSHRGHPSGYRHFHVLPRVRQTEATGDPPVAEFLLTEAA